MIRAAVLLTCLSLVSLHAQSVPPRPIGDGQITGRVLTPAGEPIEGVEVSVTYFSTEPAHQFVYVTTSKADGEYGFYRLPVSNYRVIARKAGYSNMTTQPLGEGVYVDLRRQSSVSGIDLVLRPTGTITGHVRRPDGSPVAKAMVAPQVRRADGSLIGVQRPFTTGPDGAYTLTNVAPGSYAVLAIYSIRQEMLGKPEPAEYEDWAKTFHPSTTSFDEATRVEISGGDVHESIDITLQPDPRFSVSGVIVDSSGAPLPNAKLEFGSGSYSGGVDVSLRAAGHFEVRGISNGRVRLMASADSSRLVGYATVDVQCASIRNVRLELGVPAIVRGRVVTDTPSIAVGKLRVVFNTPWFRPDVRDSFEVRSDGSFTATTLIGERIIDVVGLPDEADMKELRRAGNVIPERRLTLTNGQVIDDLEVIVSSRN